MSPTTSVDRLTNPRGDDGAELPSDHRRLLTNTDGGNMTSSEGEEVEDNNDGESQDSTGQSIVGISIGQKQDRLRSPQTPAVEKEEALRGQDPFDAQLRKGARSEGASDDPERALQPQPCPSAVTENNRSKQTGLSRHLPNFDGALSSIYPGTSGRTRAYTGPQPQSRKAVPFALPQLPSFARVNRFSLPSIDEAVNWMRASGGHEAKSKTTLPPSRDFRPPQVGHTPAYSAQERRSTSFDDSRDPSTAGRAESPRPLLRRSTSDGSLTLRRSASRASSLGDDTRWEGLQEQVNSRFKAIKDSWADTSIRMPRLKPGWLEAGRSGVYGANSGRTQQHSIPNLRTLPGFNSKQQPVTTGNGSISPPGGMNTANVEAHPHFTKALKRIRGDVVILGGYRGSILRSADPPHRQLWIPVKVGLNLRKVNLEVGLSAEDEERMPETIIPSGMLKNIGPVDISRRLIKRLRSCRNAEDGALRVHDYGYDWRLSPHLLSKQLEAFIESLPCNRPGVPPNEAGATIIAHSLGGLIIRHIVNRRPELFSGVVYAGVPQTCVNVLGPLRNGDEVLLSSKVLTAQVNFTIRTSFALLPLDGKCFIDEETKEEYPVDFFDPKTWEQYRLSPCVARPLPPSSRSVEPQGLVSGLVNSMASVLPSVSVRKNSVTKHFPRSDSPSRRALQSAKFDAGRVQDSSMNSESHHEGGPEEPVAPQMGHLENPQQYGGSEEKTISTAVTIPREKAYEYLTRTLAEVKAFKQELAYRPDLETRYPPASVMYGRSTPTVCGAKVKGREGIKQADAYERLQFASGDGVVLARAAQIPEGYHSAPGGVVSSDRGHITLLGDLEAVGKCLNAIVLEKRRRTQHATIGSAAHGSDEKPQSSQ